jgi:hypothetical protein
MYAEFFPCINIARGDRNKASANLIGLFNIKYSHIAANRLAAASGTNIRNGRLINAETYFSIVGVANMVEHITLYPLKYSKNLYFIFYI